MGWIHPTIDPPDHLQGNGLGEFLSAVKNCYLAQKPRAPAMEDASAEADEAPPRRPVLIVVNKQHL